MDALKEVKLIKRQDTFKMILQKEVADKIDFVCRNLCSKREWSGVLFYTPEGNFEDKNLVIRCNDIYLMDIGSEAFTEFNMSPDVIHYMSENPNLIDCQMGLIHSHHNMSTFFSSTDINTLKEEGLDRLHFVSLIVNNSGTYSAAITRRVKTTKTGVSKHNYTTFGEVEISNSENLFFEEEEIEWFELKIEFEESKNNLYRDVKDRFLEISRVKTSLFSNQESQDKTNKDKEGLKGVGEKENIDSSHDLYFIDMTGPRARRSLGLSEGILSTIKSLTLQLITGSIIIPNESKIDNMAWSEKMVPLFNRRFGIGEKGFKNFKAWADMYIEYLCWFTKDEEGTYSDLTEDELVDLYARGIIKELNKLSMNEYIKAYIQILQGYIL